MQCTIERSFQNQSTASKFTSKSGSLIDKDNIEHLTKFSDQNMKRNNHDRNQV